MTSDLEKEIAQMQADIQKATDGEKLEKERNQIVANKMKEQIELQKKEKEADKKILEEQIKKMIFINFCAKMMLLKKMESEFNAKQD